MTNRDHYSDNLVGHDCDTEQPATGIAFAFFATVALTLIFGWIFIFAGIAQIVYAYL
ncbi:MAG: DUF308 domain-containing protein [Nostoc sp.]|uniref:DUF308 domain-containing protein n=1 Tax=Nostoc sp. TaxID=1180 RepID=UPI002FFC12B7